MAYTRKIGKGLNPWHGSPIEGMMGCMLAEVRPEHGTMTLEQFADQLAKQAGIVNGEVKIIEIGFTINSQGRTQAR